MIYMPIYEYRCESCGAELEKIQKFSDAPLTDCPACGKASLKKLVSASSFRLKGTGWYETDFKNKNKSSSAAAGAASKAGNTDKDSSASEKSGDTGSKNSGNSGNKKDGKSSNDSSNDKGSGKASGNSSKDSGN